MDALFGIQVAIHTPVKPVFDTNEDQSISTGEER
jgi:hypothetical protein